MVEKTLVILKPDAVERGVVGEIISRFEKIGLRVVNAKMIKATEDLARNHYPVTEEWLAKVGGNTLSDFQKYGFDAKEHLGTEDPVEVGKMIHRFNQEYLQSGPVLALILEGNHAIELVRKLVGTTVPSLSPAGTIRGDYSGESALVATMEKRSIRNLIHASGTSSEAEREIALWFGE